MSRDNNAIFFFFHCFLKLSRNGNLFIDNRFDHLGKFTRVCCGQGNTREMCIYFLSVFFYTRKSYGRVRIGKIIKFVLCVLDGIFRFIILETPAYKIVSNFVHIFIIDFQDTIKITGTAHIHGIGNSLFGWHTVEFACF